MCGKGHKIFLSAFFLLSFSLAGWAEDITVTLKPNGVSGTLLVSFGLPLPPKHLSDTTRIAVFDGATEVAAYVGQLIPWRGIYAGSVRSAIIQFEMTFATATTTRTVTVKTNVARTQNRSAKVPVDSTCLTAACTEGPKVWALLPADWLCKSWLAGPQLPSSRTPSTYTGYEGWADTYFPGILSYNLSGAGGEPWLYDRVSTLYKLYARRGTNGTNGENFLKEAFRSAHLYRVNIDASGCFIPKGCDGKYSYSEALALHYLLWGDERFKTPLMRVTMYHRANPTRLYTVNAGFTERNFGFNWMTFIHAWEILGRSADSLEMMSHLDAAVSHQNNPPDGKGPDGSWRHWIGDHDASEGTNVLGASPWMSSLVIDAVVKQFFATGDRRCVDILQKWARYARDVARMGTTQTWYFSTPDTLVGRTGVYSGQTVTLQGPIDGSGSEHNFEFVYMLAAGYWAGKKTDAGLLSAIGPLYNAVLGSNGNDPPRKYQWALRNTSQFTWFLDNATLPPDSFIVQVGIEKAEGERLKAGGMQLDVNPNPFKTDVRFQISGVRKGINTKLSIYNAAGKLIAILTSDPPMADGLTSTYSWKSSAIPAGVYFARLQADQRTVTKRILLLK